VGLGDRFLRHIERTRVIVHRLDAGSFVLESVDLMERYEAIRRELGAYSPDLLKRRELVVLSKIDLVPNPGDLDSIEAELCGRGLPVLRISAIGGAGISALLDAMLQSLDDVGANSPTAEDAA
jgi:GTP-binding protein